MLFRSRDVSHYWHPNSRFDWNVLARSRLRKNWDQLPVLKGRGSAAHTVPSPRSFDKEMLMGLDFNELPPTSSVADGRCRSLGKEIV